MLRYINECAVQCEEHKEVHGVNSLERFLLPLQQTIDTKLSVK